MIWRPGILSGSFRHTAGRDNRFLGEIGFPGRMAGWAISRSCSAFLNQSCSGRGPLIQDLLGFESRVDKGIPIVALLCKAVMRRDEDVDGQYEMLGDGGANGVVALWPVVQGCGDDEEIDVAVGAGVAAGVAAEEDDLLPGRIFGRSTGQRPELSPCRSGL